MDSCHETKADAQTGLETKNAIYVYSIYVYICIYVYKCVYNVYIMCIYICIYIYMCVSMYICIYVYIDMYIHRVTSSKLQMKSIPGLPS